MRPSLLLIFLVPFAAQAETIQLKTGGHINLSTFDCTPVIESQLLHRVCYNEANHYLIAQIGSEYYDNCNVGPKAVDGLMDSNHVVAYYNQHIRAGHECTSDLRRGIGMTTLGALELGNNWVPCRSGRLQYVDVTLRSGPFFWPPGP